ncbi:MAG: prepilin-type N-terminal cleavage/methylation domain-containing protein, partial [Clostridiales bacterium]|nr:prepilin-type N-terminal cleavage/methylation domain-containing protein [Clostridiales bacterium]
MKLFKRLRENEKGFTLVELIIVIAILAILALLV